jgi:hypothetical protein
VEEAHKIGVGKPGSGQKSALKTVFDDYHLLGDDAVWLLSNLSLSSLPIEENYVRFEVSTAVTMMIIIFWDMIIIIVTAVET